MSEQPLTAFMKLSYGRQDFAKAEGHKTENREGDTHPQRGGRRVKNCTLAKKGKSPGGRLPYETDGDARRKF